MKKFASFLPLFLLTFMTAHPKKALTQTNSTEGASVISYYGYDDCIELKNRSVRVVLCPAAGGRILVYELQGKNILYLPPGDEGWKWDGSNDRGNMNAGRFDIGPEQVVPKRNKLWQGEWKGEILGDRHASLTSPVDEGPGVYLVREFKLAESSSKLECKQTIVSASDEPVEYCHWSRTFCNGKGTCIVPVSKPGRFSEGYVRYDQGRLLNMKPTDANVQRKGDFLVVTDHPESPKLGFDSMSGWFAYHAKQDLLFVKKFPTYPDRMYNEVAGLTVSIWYPDREMVELEPIGPRERLEKRGDKASFTETWFLMNHEYPGENVQPLEIQKMVRALP